MSFAGRIGIIGAGALGALYGARIARAGHDVHFLLRGDYEAVQRDGLKVFSPQGDFEMRPPVYPSPGAMGPCDLLIVGMKATDIAALAPILAHTTHAETVVLTLQNGLGNEEAIAAMLDALHSDSTGRGRVIGGVAFLCSNRTAPGVIHHMSYGRVRMAELAGPALDRTRAIAQLFLDAEFGCEVSDSLATIRWEKLVWNIPFNGLGVAAHHADSQVCVTDDELLRVSRGLMEEVVAAARAADGVEIAPAFIDLMMKYTLDMGPYRSSMQLDHEAGRPLEVEAILGEPVRRARAAGIAVPRMEMLYAIVRRVDAVRV